MTAIHANRYFLTRRDWRLRRGRIMRILAFVACFALASITWGQVKYITISPEPVPASCHAAVDVLRAKITEVGAPDRTWTFAVVCTESTWARSLDASKQDGKTCCAFTILDRAFTIVYAPRLTDPLPEVTPGYLIAHELGHISTGSTREREADAWARERGYRWAHRDEPRVVASK